MDKAALVNRFPVSREVTTAIIRSLATVLMPAVWDTMHMILVVLFGKFHKTGLVEVRYIGLIHDMHVDNYQVFRAVTDCMYAQSGLNMSTPECIVMIGKIHDEEPIVYRLSFDFENNVMTGIRMEKN